MNSRLGGRRWGRGSVRKRPFPSSQESSDVGGSPTGSIGRTILDEETGSEAGINPAPRTSFRVRADSLETKK